jgi:hypothetical protein
MTPALDGQIGPSQPFKGPFEVVEAHDLAGSQGFLVGDWTLDHQAAVLGYLEPFRGFLGLFRGFLGPFLGFLGLFLGFRVGFRA